MLSVSLRFTCVQAWRNVSTNVSCCLRPFQLNGSGTVADFSQYFCAFFSSVSVCKCEWVFLFFSLLRLLFSFLSNAPRSVSSLCVPRAPINDASIGGEQCTFSLGYLRRVSSRTVSRSAIVTHGNEVFHALVRNIPVANGWHGK